MKRKLAAVVTTLLVLTLTACGSSSADSAGTAGTGTTGSANSQSTQVTQTGGSENEVQSLFRTAKSGSYATISVDASVKMDDTSAWLGLCPAGKDYITELEADEVDVIWFNADAREADSDPYVFACDFEPVEDGTYALVVATSDDAEVGYIAIQLTMEKNGDSLKFDFDNAKRKERPAK